MAIPGYTPGNPQSGQTLGNSRQIIQKNLDGTFLTLGVDHQNQNLANPGFHNVIHFIPNPAPAAIPGIGQLWAQQINDGIVSDEILFYKSGGNRQFQFTRNFQPTNSATYISGVIPGIGAIFQSGVITLATGSGTVSLIFPTPFPIAAPFVVVCPYISGSLSTDTQGWALISVDQTHFRLIFGGYAIGDQFFWYAVGN